MGNGSAKKTNNLLDENRNRSYQQANTLNNYGAEDRKYNTDTRGFVDSKYRELYDGVNQQGGGGGGGYTPMALPALRDNESLGTYRDFMNNGGYNADQQRDFRSRAEGIIPSFFSGIKRQMEEAGNIRGGGYAGYSGQLAKLAREKAQEAEKGRLGSEVELQSAIRSGKLQGAGGVERLDRERMNAEESRARETNAGMAAAAGAGRANQDSAFRERMSILNEMRGLRGEGGTDLSYYNAGSANNAAGQNAINSRVTETPAWQKALGAVGGIAGAVMPFVGGAANIGSKLLGGGGNSVANNGIANSNDWSKWARG